MTLIIAVGLAAATTIVAGAAVGSAPLIVAAAATLAIPLVLVIPSSARRSPKGEDDRNSGDGGSRLEPRPRNPRGPTHTAQPEWWPQFEREFAAHVERDRRRGTTPAPPA